MHFASRRSLTAHTFVSALLLTAFATAIHAAPPAKPKLITISEGTDTQITVSPDHKTIIADLQGLLFSMPISGGEARKITSGMGFNSQPRFSPDGKKITFLSDRGGSENIWIADADGANPRQLTKLNGGATGPVWAANGSEIAFTSARDAQARGPIQLSVRDMSDEELLAIIAGEDGAPAARPVTPAASSNGRNGAQHRRKQKP